jgi:hypothetical protein
LALVDQARDRHLKPLFKAYDGLKQHVIARQPKAAGTAPAAGKTTP